MPLTNPCPRLVAVLGLALMLAAAPQGRCEDHPSPRTAGAKDVEIVRGESAEVGDELVVLFQTDDEHYFTLRPEELEQLRAAPAVKAPAGMKAEVTSFTVTERKVQVSRGDTYGPNVVEHHYGVGDGYVLSFRVRVSAEKDLAPGDYEVVVSVPEASVIAIVNRALEPKETPTLTLKVKVWASAAAREQAHREEEARRRREADEQAFRTCLTVAAVVGGIAGAITLLVLLVRLCGWLFPKYRVRVARGGSATATVTFTEDKAVSLSELLEPPGVLTKYPTTAGFFGGRPAVRVKCVGVPVDSELYRTRTDYYRGGHFVGSVDGFKRKVTYRMEVTATAGPNVAPGRYLADCPGGLLAVTVTNERADAVGSEVNAAATAQE